MRQALTCILAAACGALLVFLFLSENPSGPEASDPRTVERHPKDPGRPPSRNGATSIFPRAKERVAAGEEVTRDEFILELMGPAPSRDELEDWLASRGRDAESLLAAGIILSDLPLLTEALKKDPDNPHILFTLANFQEATPEQRLQWSRRLLEVQPHNAMGSYSLASQLFEGGDHEAALSTLRASANQLDFEDFSMHSILLTEEAYLGTGSSLFQAKLRSTVSLPIPHLADIRGIAKYFGEGQEQLSDGEADELRTWAGRIGVRLAEESSPKFLGNEMFGLSLQMAALRDQPGDAPSPFQNLSVGEAESSIQARQDEIREAVELTLSPEVLDLSPEMIEAFIDRTRLIGELPAIEWARRQVELQAGE